MYPEYEHRSDPLIIHRNRHASTYPLRLHEHIELMWICGGSAEVTIGSGTHTLYEGDLYIVFPDILHSAVIPEGTERLLLLFSPDTVPEFTDTFCRFCPADPILRRGNYPQFLEDLLVRIHQLYRAGTPGNRILACHLNALAAELLQLLCLEDRSSDSHLVHQMVSYLLEHYTGEVTLEDMARQLGYNKYHLSHVLSTTFRCNFRTLLNSYRVTMAQNLLLTTGKSISQIAFSCGFRNQSSFNRVFLKHCAMTPRSFRAQNTPENVDPPHMIVK